VINLNLADSRVTRLTEIISPHLYVRKISWSWWADTRCK